MGNTVAAAIKAHDTMGNLEAIELGNEPNCKSTQRELPFSIAWELTLFSLQQLRPYRGWLVEPR
jgi:hypothetical protein